MPTTYYLNIILWTVDTFLFFGILLSRVLFTRVYKNWHVPRINTYNDVIDSQTIQSLIIEFKSMFNLNEYEVEFIDDQKVHRLFWNLKNKNKKIIISKRIFESVGYELDYLISRIWISAKEVNKDWKIRNYKIVVKYLPFIFLFILIGFYLVQSIIFFYGLSNSESDINFKNKVLYYLWVNPWFAAAVILIFLGLSLNFFVGMKMKTIIEKYYNSEVSGIVKIVLENYYHDFHAARTYAQSITIPMSFTHSSKNDKWLGPFVY